MDKFTRTLSLLGAGAAFVVAAPALAAPPSTTAVVASPAATARAQIVDPLTLTKTSDLDFGTLVKKTTLGAAETVVIDESGVVTCTTNLLCSGTPTAASFDVAGSADQVVKVYIAASTLTAPGGATLTFTPSSSAVTTSPVLDGSGNASFKVAGSIDVASTTASGIYVGNMDVTVDYN
ncbi:MAG: DUF4402 domain-containing protein [Sphingomicrobium sp.]|nr:DUF4402 domain-containing protein [Sphingomonadales bacterium]